MQRYVVVFSKTTVQRHRSRCSTARYLPVVKAVSGTSPVWRRGSGPGTSPVALFGRRPTSREPRRFPQKHKGFAFILFLPTGVDVLVQIVFPFIYSTDHRPSATLQYHGQMTDR
ncbi:hypothetical protein VTN02DRAFT_2899 [Thermoascus thermophilus]